MTTTNRSYGKASPEIHAADEKAEEGWRLMADWLAERITCAEFWPRFRELMTEYKRLDKAAKTSIQRGQTKLMEGSE